MAHLTEADTCRKYVLPKLYAAGWDDERINEQKTFTDGRIVVAGNKTTRKPQKRADYLLRYRPDFAIAVVEAKPSYKNPGDGLQQAKDYAQVLGLKFAYSTNGHGIVEHDFTTGRDNDLEGFPSAGSGHAPLPRPTRDSDPVPKSCWDSGSHPLRAAISTGGSRNQLRSERSTAPATESRR